MYKNVLRSSFELIMSQITNISLRGFENIHFLPNSCDPDPWLKHYIPKGWILSSLLMIGAELAEIFGYHKLGIQFWPWLQTMNFKVKCLGLVGHEYLGRLFCY